MSAPLHPSTGRRRSAATAPFALTVLVSLAALVGACAQPTPPTDDAGRPSAAAQAETASAGAATTSEPGADAATDGAPVSGSAATATAMVAARLPQLETVVGREGTEPGELMLPVDVAVDADGNLFVSDTSGVQKLSPEGQFLTRIGGDKLLTANGGLALSGDGRLYVTGFGPEVWVFDVGDGTLLSTLGEAGDGPGQLAQPVDVAVDTQGNVFVADAGGGKVEVYGPDDRHVRTIGSRGASSGQFTTPRSVAVEGDGHVLVGVGDDYIVQRFAADGTYIDAFGEAHADENAWRLGGLAVDDEGNVYMSQALSGRVQQFAAPDMHLDWELGEVGTGPEAFSSPLGIAVAGGKLYVADQSNHRVKVYRLRP